ncbi:MAG TPA: YraN family protein [Candidatus Sulfotelmatobacter sp.]|nr:YraN family protein [Candidatus Sulfotelmatobacter sp.]
MLISNPTAKLGEEIAVKFLKEKGYKIIERNFRKGYGEIDIIAVQNNTLVFVEVKTRTTSLFGGAANSISYHKLQTLIKTAQFYKLINKNLPDSLRIDAILIDLDKKSKVSKIEHVENITGF